MSEYYGQDQRPRLARRHSATRPARRGTEESPQEPGGREDRGSRESRTRLAAVGAVLGDSPRRLSRPGTSAARAAGRTRTHVPARDRLQCRVELPRPLATERPDAALRTLLPGHGRVCRGAEAGCPVGRPQRDMGRRVPPRCLDIRTNTSRGGVSGSARMISGDEVGSIARRNPRQVPTISPRTDPMPGAYHLLTYPHNPPSPQLAGCPEAA